MSSELEIKKKSRKALRSAFTRAAKEFDTLTGAEGRDKDFLRDIRVVFELLSAKVDSLCLVNNQIYELWLESATDEELETEIQSWDEYTKRFTQIKIRYEGIIEETESTKSIPSRRTEGPCVEDNSGMRKFRLPMIEFKQYDGGIKDWLPFWAQFKRIHEDCFIEDCDKIEYLKQATIPNSRARRLVESYPVMAENYPKIIESMQSRFGREDLQIEVYVRELLKLLLNSSSAKRIDVSFLYDRIETQLRALDTLGITSDRCAAILYPLIESCLPNELMRVWQRSSFHNSMASLEEQLKNLMNFLQQEVENEQRISMAAEGFGLTEKYAAMSVNEQKGKYSQKKAADCATAQGLINVETAGCIFCKGSHESDNCFKAQKMSLSQKRDVLFKKKACFKCLKIGHQGKRCKGHLRCVLCSRSHSTLMCPNLPLNQTDPRSSPQGNDGSVEIQDQVLTNQTTTHVFLQTLKIKLRGINGSKVVRALIDTGSQRSYILRETAGELGLKPKRQENLIHCLFGGSEVTNKHCCFDVTCHGGERSYTFEVLDQLRICNDVAPVMRGPWIDELHTAGVDVSDVGDAGPIELLVGADAAGDLYTGKRLELSCGLTAYGTHFGWTLMGKKPTKVSCNVALTTMNLLFNEATITDLWDLEAIGIKEPSDKNSKCEMALEAKDFFLRNVRIIDGGRYEVRLPWLEEHPPIDSNYALAQKRLSSVVRKLKKDNIYEGYEGVFEEWRNEGIIEPVKEDSMVKSRCHYLPHRPVVKIESTTKIRPVFDASAHEKDKPSLNHCLEKGPNMIELIPSLLLRFREHKFGVISDIRKAFLQISIHNEDRDFLRFIWLDSEGKETILRHGRVVFGLNSSPFLLAMTLEYHLNRCLQNCDTSNDYSKDTVKRLSRSFYVDNCVTSLPDEQTVESFIGEAVTVMAEGQFDLRGWEHTRYTTREEKEEPCSVLGLRWYPQRDVFTVNPTFFEKDIDGENFEVTKRIILSMTQRVFDPIGFLSPALLLPKLILQTLWKDKLSWDQPIEEVKANTFKVWVRNLHYLKCVEIPRWILIGNPDIQNRSIHTFCDASQDAYACAVFLRCESHDKVHVFLLAAKARVAPIKKSDSKMTIPRLELLAATIGARMFSHVRENLDYDLPCFFWSDSSTVISWIQRKEEWGVFVWNRVLEIRTLTSESDWRHLPGKLNPADLPSRGCSPKQLLESRWWEGPEWLYGPQTTWPVGIPPSNEREVNAERKKKLVTTLLDVNLASIWHLDHFFKYDKTVRMMAWIFRFVRHCKKSCKRRFDDLSVEELDRAEIFILKLIQSGAFSGVDDQKIIGLNPFLDERGLIRLKSRVVNREDTDNFRFPIVLPSKNQLVERLIVSVHLRSHHVGTQGLLSLLREKFWILGGRRTVRSAVSKCVVCKRYDAKPMEVISPPLPIDRVRDAVAFEVSGVDFAGPLFLRNGEKAWICLFTCAIYRAVHLELCTSLSTSNFFQAFRRFVSRRGRPKTVYSDNGTNFIGAENALAALDWDTIVRETSVQRIQWRFNPPTSSWWGGFWERLIGVLKKLLRKSLGRASLNYEQLVTLLCECEAVVNERPLTYLSDDPSDLVALSPSMFLRDKAECGLPDCDVIDSASLSRKARQIQTLRENLRGRFRAEYLGQLKLLSERKNARPVTVGDLVLVGNDNSKRLEWPVARVIELLPGKDGEIRLVRVETSKGSMLRPIQRLYPLECFDAPEFRNGKLPSSCEKPTETKPENQTFGDSGSCVSAKGPCRAQEVCQVKTTRSGRECKVPSRYKL